MVHAGRGCSIVSGQFHGKDQSKRSTPPKFNSSPLEKGMVGRGLFSF